MSAPLKPFSALIPAAGQSLRMGSNKAFLKQPDGSSFLEKLITGFQNAGADPVAVVINEAFDISGIQNSGCLYAVNNHLELGRSHSIRLGAEILPHDRPCFLQNVDNPVLDQNLVRKLFSSCEEGTYVVPIVRGRGGHPILLSSEILNAILSQEFQDFRNVLKMFKRKEIHWNDPGILLNINTLADYTRFMKNG